jgi:iron(II)-dependent oxidoreductase
MYRRSLLAGFAVLTACAALLALPARPGEWIAHHDLVFPPDAPSLGDIASPSAVFIAGPDTPAAGAAWSANLDAWRKRTRNELGLRGDERPAGSSWARSAFTQDEVLIWDRSLYDAQTRQYTVDRFLAGVESRVGPLDTVLLWPTYPNLGVDERDQFDQMRDMPGGIAGVRALIAAFHAHNIRVLLPYLAWDTGTRAESDSPAHTMAELQAALGADGVNFDGLNSVPDSFRATSEERGHPLALEPQFDIVDGSLAHSALSWSDWVTWDFLAYPTVPMVSKTKLLEPGHMVEVTDRYTRVKTDSLQHAFFNGEGYAVLENLWGNWQGFSARDAETVLRTARIEHAFPDLLASPDWQPHVPTVQPGVYASAFPGAAATLWTLVNRNAFDVDGEQLAVPAQPGLHYYDLWHGVELTPRTHGLQATLDFSLEGLGYGAILVQPSATPSPALSALLAFMHQRSAARLDAYSYVWQAAPQTMLPIAPAPLASAPPGMVRIPGGAYDFVVRGNEIEGGNDPGVDVQFPWENAARRTHRRHIQLAPYFIDRTPVTNAEFARFLAATHYRPADDHNFLRDWSNGTFPPRWANKPVTWVSIEDARAYAAWAGKRLPHDWEWQFAAQSADGRLYPWGNDADATRMPAIDHGRRRPAPADVDAYPRGASPFGVLDLEGNVSQWTDEFSDEHTRAAIVRGGAAYRPLGSVWYFPQTDRLDEHQKYLLVSPGHDRAGTIGFRCVADAPAARVPDNTPQR